MITWRCQCTCPGCRTCISHPQCSRHRRACLRYLRRRLQPQTICQRRRPGKSSYGGGVGGTYTPPCASARRSAQLKPHTISQSHPGNRVAVGGARRVLTRPLVVVATAAIRRAVIPSSRSPIPTRNLSGMSLEIELWWASGGYLRAPDSQARRIGAVVGKLRVANPVSSQAISQTHFCLQWEGRLHLYLPDQHLCAYGRRGRINRAAVLSRRVQLERSLIRPQLRVEQRDSSAARRYVPLEKRALHRHRRVTPNDRPTVRPRDVILKDAVEHSHPVSQATLSEKYQSSCDGDCSCTHIPDCTLIAPPPVPVSVIPMILINRSATFALGPFASSRRAMRLY